MKNKISILLIACVMASGCGMFRKSEQKKDSVKDNYQQQTSKQTVESDTGVVTTTKRFFAILPQLPGTDLRKFDPSSPIADLNGAAGNLVNASTDMQKQFGAYLDLLKKNGGFWGEQTTNDKKGTNKASTELNSEKHNQESVHQEQKKEPAGNLISIIVIGMALSFLGLFLIIRSWVSSIRKDLQIIKSKSGIL